GAVGRRPTGQARLTRPCALCAPSRTQMGQAFSMLEIPHHGYRRTCPANCTVSAKRGGWTAVQVAQRSAGDARGSLPALDESRRAATTVQRPPWTHEPRGAAPVAVSGKPDLRPLAPGALVCSTGDNGAVADLPQ